MIKRRKKKLKITFHFAPHRHYIRCFSLTVLAISSWLLPPLRHRRENHTFPIQRRCRAGGVYTDLVSCTNMDPRQFEHIVVNDNDIHSIVMSYLLHNCFDETADSLASTTGIHQPVVDRDNMERRKQIMRFVLEKKALKAVELTTEQLGQELLEKNKDLHFDLLCLHFVELICDGKGKEALEFAKTSLAPFGNSQKYVGKLEDVIALLAYEDPEKSPMFYLLSSEYRQQVADDLNRTILEHAKQPSYTPMERLLQQVTVARQYLTEENGKDAFPPFSLKDYVKG